MVEYFTVSISFVLISAIAIMFFLNKKKMLKKNIVQAIIISTLSMILMSVLFPYITGYLMSFNLKFTDAESSKLGIGLAVAITLTLYFVIILFLSFLVSDMVWVKGVSEKSGNTENGSIVEVFRTALGSFLSSIYPKKGVINDLEAVPALESQYTGNNYHAQNEALNRDIYENVTNDTTQNDNLESGIKEGIDTDTGILWDDTNNSQTVNLQDTAGSDENILQKPVDREQNIDTIGVVTENSAAIINDENFNADSKADEGLPEEADSKNQYNLPLEQIADFFDTSDADSNDSVLEQPMISGVSVDEKDVIIDKEDEFEVNQDFFDEEIIKEIESVDEDNLQAGEDAINEAETIENIIDENTANEGVITEDVIDEDTITEVGGLIILL